VGDYERISVDTDTKNAFDEATGGDPVLNGARALPGVTQTVDAGSAVWDMVQGDTGVAEGVSAIAMDAMHLGAQATAFALEPVATLAGWGLDVLLALVTPLQDALDWVTGSPSQMRDTAELWDRIAQANVDLSQAVADNLQPLSNWSGEDAAMAKLKGNVIAAGFYGAGSMSNDISGLLGGAQLLADTIQAVVKYLISKLIEYFIVEIAPMILASPATFGASAAMGLSWATVRASQTAIAVSTKIAKITTMFGKLSQILVKIASSRAGMVAIDALRNSLPGFIGAVGDASGTQGTVTGGTGPVQVDAEEIRKAAPTFAAIASDAAGVGAEVDGTIAEDLTWGITGWFFASSYNSQCEEMSRMMGFSEETVNLLAANIEACAADWEAADKELGDLFAGLEVEIVGTAPNGC
jgi:hypothetical protein